MFEKVLVCLDGSRLAESILPYIIQESRKIGKVIMVQVLTAPDASIAPDEPAGPEQRRVILARFEEEMDEASAYLEAEAQLLRIRRLDVDCVVLQGKPTWGIVDYARNNGISLIAIATHGLSGLREIALGSTAEYVLKNSGLPVLMITPITKN